MMTHIPSGIDGAEPASESKKYSPFVIGPFVIHRLNTENQFAAKVTIGSHDIQLEVISKECEVCFVKLYDNHVIKFSGHYYGGKATASNIGIRMMREYIRNKSGNCSGRGSFLKDAIERMETGCHA